MLCRFSFLAALLVALPLAACSDDALPPPLEVYEGGRAEVIERADSGRALLIEHEPFDSLMTRPMVMELRLADPREADSLRAGDKIRFDLVLGEHYRLRNVERLPASTRLKLAAADSVATDTTQADTSAAGGP